MLSVKMVAGDDFGPRTVRLRARGFEESIFTPDRSLSSTESRYSYSLKKWGFQNVGFNHTIFEMRKRYSQGDLNKLHTNDPFFENLKYLEANLKGNAGRLSLFRPLFYRRDTEVGWTANYALMRLGLEAGYKLITIQDTKITSPIEEFISRMEKSRSEMESTCHMPKAFELIPTVHLGTRSDLLFKQKIKACIDMGFKAVSLIYASYRHSMGNLMALQEIAKDTDTFFICSDVDRRARGGDASLMHFLQNFGIDVSSVRMPPRHDPNLNKPILRRFDQHTLGMLTPDMHKQHHGISLKCDCFVCRGQNHLTLYKMQEKFGVSGLIMAMNAHEAVKSPEEFANGRQYIASNEFQDYVKGKPYLLDISGDIPAHNAPLSRFF